MRLRPAALGLAAGITVAVVAWGFLVRSAIDFGVSARSGEDRAWWFLVLASVGAIACLFLAFVLVARLSRVLGITTAPSSRPPRGEDSSALEDTAERPAVRPGGHRAG